MSRKFGIEEGEWNGFLYATREHVWRETSSGMSCRVVSAHQPIELLAPFAQATRAEDTQ